MHEPLKISQLVRNERPPRGTRKKLGVKPGEMPRLPKFRPDLARFNRDKAYRLAFEKLRENGGNVTQDAIDRLAAQYRAEERANKGDAAALDLAAIQKGVNARVRAARKKKAAGGGLPTPRQALRAQRAREEAGRARGDVEGA